MCSLNDDDLQPLSPVAKEPPSSWDGCKKCKSAGQPSVLLRQTDAYCRSCLLQSVAHKFRSCLGKSRRLRGPTAVLLPLEPTAASVVLLHLTKSAVELESHKRLLAEPTAVIVDDERTAVLQGLADIGRSAGLPLHFASLSAHVLHADGFLSSSLPNGRSDAEFRQKMQQFRDASMRRNYLAIQRLNMLLDAGRVLGCSLLLSPETALENAANLLANICLGRGAQIAQDAAVCDDRDPSLPVVKPLKGLDLKEVTFYHHFQQLPLVLAKSRLFAHYSGRSVHSVSHDYVEMLQRSFPATISTVAKTGEKLGKSGGGDGGQCCRLCRCCVEPPAADVLTAGEATHYSHQVSTETTVPTGHVVELCYSCNRTMNAFLL